MSSNKYREKCTQHPAVQTKNYSPSLRFDPHWVNRTRFSCSLLSLLTRTSNVWALSYRMQQSIHTPRVFSGVSSCLRCSSLGLSVVQWRWVVRVYVRIEWRKGWGPDFFDIFDHDTSVPDSASVNMICQSAEYDFVCISLRNIQYWKKDGYSIRIMYATNYGMNLLQQIFQQFSFTWVHFTTPWSIYIYNIYIVYIYHIYIIYIYIDNIPKSCHFFVVLLPSHHEFFSSPTDLQRVQTCG